MGKEDCEHGLLDWTKDDTIRAANNDLLTSGESLIPARKIMGVSAGYSPSSLVIIISL